MKLLKRSDKVPQSSLPITVKTLQEVMPSWMKMTMMTITTIMMLVLIMMKLLKKVMKKKT